MSYLMEPPIGIEPMTYSLRVNCSTIWARVAIAVWSCYCSVIFLVPVFSACEFMDHLGQSRNIFGQWINALMPSKLQVVQKIGNTTLYIWMCDTPTFYNRFCHIEDKDVRWSLIDSYEQKRDRRRISFGTTRYMWIHILLEHIKETS